LRRIIRWIVGLPIVVVVIAFVVANRQWTRLSLDPFSSTSPAFSIEMPLWALFIFGVFIGILVGWTACWFAQGKHRKLARDRGHEITQLHNDVANTMTAASNEKSITPYPGLMP
jgi:hypothetical protein